MSVPKLKYGSGNSASTTVSSSVSNTDTSIPLTSDTNFSAKSGEGMVLIDEGQATQELSYATGKSGSSLTIPLANRGLEGTSSQPHTGLSSTVRGILTVGMWNDLIDTLKKWFDQTTGNITPVLGSDADGDMYYRASGVLSRLGIGVNGKVLVSNGTAPTWGDVTVPVKASGAEINTGTDDAKFTTAKAIADSNIVITDKVQTLSNKTISTPVLIGIDGWFSANETWTYATANTFTVSGDVTTKYVKGTRLKFTQTTVKYAVVIASSYSNPNTTVTIATNTDYTIANAAISANYYSYMIIPQGYPDWFTFTPSLTGSGGSAGTYAQSVDTARFKIDGRMCVVSLSVQITNKGSWTTDILLALPVPTPITGSDTIYHNCWLQTSGVPIAGAKAGFCTASGTTIKAINSFRTSAASWGTNVTNNDRIWGVFSYEI